MLATIPSATLHGYDRRPVLVEAHVGPGMPGFTVVGLPDYAYRETRDRIRAALLSSHLRWPTRTVTVSLTPPGMRTVPAGLDLTIAVALLVADEQLDPSAVSGRAFIGELGLDGTVRPVREARALVDALDVDEIVVATGCVTDAPSGQRIIRTVGDLTDLIAALQGRTAWPSSPR